MAKGFIDLTGSRFVNMLGYPYEVVRYLHKEMPNGRVRLHYEIKFLVTGTVTIARSEHVKDGRVKDVYYPDVLGVGCWGVPDDYTKQDKVRWDNMLRRCYGATNKQDRMKSYLGCTVSTRWLCFEYFLKDLKSMENYGKANHDLDKDLIKDGNKVYCLEFCQLIPRGINRAASRKL